MPGGATSGIRTRTLIAEDNLVMRTGLRAILTASAEVSVIGETSTDPESVERARRLSPDVIVLGTPTGWWTRQVSLDALVGASAVLLIASEVEPSAVQRALGQGATGYLVHGQFTPDDLVTAVLATGRGQPYLSPAALCAIVESFRNLPDGPADPAPPDQRLSPREAELMELIVVGHSNREIARMLYISEKTVKNHVNHIYTKLGGRTRAEAIAIWLGLRESQANVHSAA